VFQSIVVGTDGSDTAKKAVAAAIELARLTRARLEIVSAYEPATSEHRRAEARYVPGDMQWIVNQREEVDATLSEAAERAAGGGAEARTYAREGDPADAILDVAEELGSELIVVGNKGMTGAKRFLLGSVPNKVSHHAPCSVMIVRTT
jgi:nucleotide-binding universal stress UspA family protein